MNNIELEYEITYAELVTACNIYLNGEIDQAEMMADLLLSLMGKE